MGLELDYNDGQTPLDEEEKEGLLIKMITTHGELNEFEQLGVEKANEWLLSKKLDANKILTKDFVQDLHKKCSAMFGNGLVNSERRTRILVSINLISGLN